MKIDLFNVEEFIELNNVQQVTSAVLFQRGNVPDPNGLISNRIFGITVKSRKETFAYIDLHIHFFHPHVYKALKRMFRNVERIVNGTEYYSIASDGSLVLDENGETGIEFLYDNWEKIKWKYSEVQGMRNERVDLLKNFKKDEVFMRYQLVIPAFYRDIISSSTGSGGKTGDLNKLYCNLIRLSSLIENRDMFDFQFHSTNANIQKTLIDIYDYFKLKLEKKNGLFRKFLLGKNVDYCTRSVITAPLYHADKVEDVMTSMEYAAIPISQIISLLYPFVMHWLTNFFQREIFEHKHDIMIYNKDKDEVEYVSLKNPEEKFNEKYFKKMIDQYVKDPGTRFNTIEAETETGEIIQMRFTGKRFDPATKTEISALANRPLTVTDLLYMASVDASKDKHCICTRYPLTDEFGLFIAKVRVSSTTNTMPMMVNGQIYDFYPVVEFETPEEHMAIKFVDSVRFSNSYLKGLGGD